MYNPLNILNAYDNINKAKNFCKEEYGININDWTLMKKDNIVSMIQKNARL